MSGCATPAAQQALVSKPVGLALNQETNTVYAIRSLVPGSMAIFTGRS